MVNPREEQNRLSVSGDFRGRSRAISPRRVRRIVRFVTTATAAVFAAAVLQILDARADGAEPGERPNVVLIMSDDMGFSDIGCYGGEINTPTLDALAADGLRFTQFYNTGRCCPTRASLMTGLYPHQAGVGHMMGDDELPGYRGNLNEECLTIAEALEPAGYRAYMAGKWHLTRHTAPDGPKHNWPLQRGFDRFYGTIHGAGSFYDPNSLVRGNEMISPYADPDYRPERFYYTDAISDHAARYVREHQRDHAGTPFFLYVAYTAAHWPMHALEQDIASYRGQYDGGYGPIREARFRRLKQLGIIADHWPLSPQAQSWDDVEHKAWEARCMEVYAAMIDCMDRGIGRIVEALDETGQRENTLILFLQDNGGCAEGLGRKPRGDFKKRPDEAPFPAMDPAALQTNMIPKQTRDGWPVVSGPGIMPGPADTYIAYGQGWANASNTPFRRYKHWVHEGGIATPLIANWPAVIACGGRLVRQPSHLIDIMATCVDLSGAQYPAERDGRQMTPIEGVSLRPLLEGAERVDRGPIFWEHEGNRAVRDGRWKLVSDFPGPWELYDIEADRTELDDLAEKYPEKVERLASLYDRWAERANVVPWKQLQEHRRQRRKEKNNKEPAKE